MKIDINRLRAVCTESDGLHAALMVATEKTRTARKALADARHTFAAWERSEFSRAPHYVRDPKSPRGKIRVEHPQGARLAAEVERVEQAYEAAEVAQDRARDAWDHAARIATRARTFAAEHGALPADLARD